MSLKKEAVSATTLVTATDDPGVLKNEGVEELPFVPASQRKQVAEPVDDTIVVVGQPKRKKRKRVAEKATDAADATPEQEPSVKEEEAVEAFDYASVPNILDDGSDHERAGIPRAKKQKHVKGESRSYRGCRVVPRF